MHTTVAPLTAAECRAFAARARRAMERKTYDHEREQLRVFAEWFDEQARLRDEQPVAA